MPTRDVMFMLTIRPSRLTVHAYVELDQATAEKAQRIMDAGYRFKIDMLEDGSVHGTIIGDDDSHVQFMCMNGPDVPAHINKMINDFKL